MKEKNIEILTLAIAFFIILLSNIIFSNPGPFEDLKCSDVWGSLCNLTTTNDAFPPCNGTQIGDKDWSYVSEVYINATNFFPESGINVTCKFREIDGVNNYEYLWYYNTTDWINIQNWTVDTDGIVNKPTVFKINSSEGMHIVRCVISLENATSSDCANSSTTSAEYYDNDDVNFTVTNHLTYNFWNITNATNTAGIPNGLNYTRTNSTGSITYINVSAYWNKNISYAVIEHNGTGSWTNYTIASPYTGSWTNYTLDLSNATQFNNRIIAIRAIYANDTYSVDNKTSALLYFYLDPGNPPNISSIGFYRAIQPIEIPVNLFYDSMEIRANVKDDIGLSAVIANITYPNGNRVNAIMTGENTPGTYTTWSFAFNSTLPLNETGNYTVTVIARDIGGQEKVSGQDAGCDASKNLTVNNTYDLQDINSTFNRGENVTLTVIDRLNNGVTVLNWTVNLIKSDGENTTFNGTNTITFRLNDTIPVGCYTMTVNVSEKGNNGTRNYEFNVSNTLSPLFSQPTLNSQFTTNTEISGVSNQPKVRIYNARNETLDYTVNVTLICPNGNSTLNLTGSDYYNSSFACMAASSVGNFSINATTSDNYGNSGNFSLNLRAISSGSGETVTIISSGGGGGGSGTEKNTTIIINNTLNATQQSARDFNFTLSSSSVEIEQGQDATIIGSLFNIGNQPLVLNATLESKCCNITLPKGFELGIKKETAFSINIHVPLFQDLGEYVVNVSLSTSGITKEKAFKIIVKKSTSINSLNDLEKKLLSLESQVAEYEKLGMDVNDLKRMIENTKQLLSGGKSSINRDSSDSLKNSLDNANKIISSLSSKLPTLGVQKFLHQNKYNIGLALTTIVLTTYTATQVIYPYHKLSQELKFLTEEEAALVQSRIDAERQFFKRTINEQTFTNIMITKQEKVLKTRAMLKLKQEEKAGLVKSKLSPKAFVGWIKNGSITTFYTIKSSPRNIVDKIKSKMKREEVKSY